MRAWSGAFSERGTLVSQWLDLGYLPFFRNTSPTSRRPHFWQDVRSNREMVVRCHHIPVVTKRASFDASSKATFQSLANDDSQTDMGTAVARRGQTLSDRALFRADETCRKDPRLQIRTHPLFTASSAHHREPPRSNRPCSHSAFISATCLQPLCRCQGAASSLQEQYIPINRVVIAQISAECPAILGTTHCTSRPPTSVPCMSHQALRGLSKAAMPEAVQLMAQYSCASGMLA